jgi:hypothetical protein
MDRRRTECFFALDGIAAETWKLIDGKRTTDQIIAQLVRKHRPPVTRFKQDFTRLIRNLNREKLIEEA